MSVESSDAAGRQSLGAAAASNRVGLTDEYSDDAEWAAVAQEYALLGHGFFARSATSGSAFQAPTDVYLHK